MVVSLKASFVLVLISSVTLSLTYISILIPFLTRLDFCPVLSHPIQKAEKVERVFCTLSTLAAIAPIVAI
jgi:hypothetical protein